MTIASEQQSVKQNTRPPVMHVALCLAVIPALDAVVPGGRNPTGPPKL